MHSGGVLTGRSWQRDGESGPLKLSIFADGTGLIRPCLLHGGCHEIQWLGKWCTNLELCTGIKRSGGSQTVMVSETAASLRFFGDDLDPDEVTRLLRGSPTHSARKGEITGPRTKRVARQGSWRRDAARQMPGNLEMQIREILVGLTTDFSVWQDVSVRFEGNVFVGLFLAEGNEGLGLAPKTLQLLAERGLSLELDIYDRPNGRLEVVP